MKTNIIENLFFNILIYSFLAPILGILYYFKFLKSKGVFIGILIYCLSIMTMLYFDEFLSSTKTLRHIYTTSYTVLEYTIFSFIIWSFIRGRKLKTVILVLFIIFILFETIHFFGGKFVLRQSFYLDSVPIGVETILIFCQIICLFYEQFQKATQHFYTTPSFWFVIGIMIYLSGSFFFNLLVNGETRELIVKYWFLTFIFETIKNIFFLIAIVVYAREVKNNPLPKNTTIPFLDIDLT